MIAVNTEIRPTTSQAPKCHMSLVHITPEMACRWLEQANFQNRRVNEAKVRKLATDIRSGKWGLTHQGIAFDTHGVLIDGQHRLWAIVEADQDVTMWVGFNFDPKTRFDVDNNTPRTITDRLKIDGNHGKVTDQHTACAKAMMRGLRHKRDFTAHEVDAIFRRHGKAIHFAVAALPKGAGRAGIAVAAVHGALARAWYSIQEQDLAEFTRMLMTGIITNHAYTAIALLRNHLVAHAGATDHASNVGKYAKTERALLAFFHAQPLSVLRPVGSEHFPLPEEWED
ncbi:MAG: hypothetical protein JW741_07505 [Sedimentisphaerales bacterium]|nr:hypothetical protein [Sedimentisphaerales bacterium]